MNNEFEKLKLAICECKMSVFSEMEKLIESSLEDVEKFYEKGNRSAGSRIRKNAQLVRKLIHHPTIRKEMNRT